MLSAPLRGASLQRASSPTTADPRASHAVDLVDGSFYSEHLDRLRVADIRRLRLTCTRGASPVEQRKFPSGYFLDI